MTTFAAILLVTLLGCVSHSTVQGCSSSQPKRLTFAIDMVGCDSARYSDFVATCQRVITEYSSYSNVVYSAVAVYSDTVQHSICGFTSGASLIVALNTYWASHTAVSGNPHAPCVYGAMNYVYSQSTVYTSSILIVLANGIDLTETVDDWITPCHGLAQSLVAVDIEVVVLQLTGASGVGCLDALLTQVQLVVASSCGQSSLQTFFNCPSYLDGCNNSNLLTLISNLLGWLLCGVFSLLGGLLGGILG